MKRTLSILFIFTISFNSFCQETDSLQKAKETISYYPNGKISSIIHGEGVKWNGECIWNDSLGNISTKETYLNGNKVGPAAYYYDNGQVSSTGNYVKYGIREGEWTTYLKNGLP